MTQIPDYPVIPHNSRIEKITHDMLLEDIVDSIYSFLNGSFVAEGTTLKDSDARVFYDQFLHRQMRMGFYVIGENNGEPFGVACDYPMDFEAARLGHRLGEILEEMLNEKIGEK